MKFNKALLLLTTSIVLLACTNKTTPVQELVTIKGKVTDFEGNLKDSAFVEIKYKNFETAYETYTDKNGQYSLTVEKGKYMAVASMILKEYPKLSSLPPDEQRLEFWAWNFIADRDTVIDIHYHRLEVYGVNVFRVQGAGPNYTIYCRPMSLTKLQEQGLDQNSDIDIIDLCPAPENMDIKVSINNEPVNVLMVQKLKEHYVNTEYSYGYLINVDLPETKSAGDYDVFHIEMTDKENGDRGEALYYKEKDNYR